MPESITLPCDSRPSEFDTYANESYFGTIEKAPVWFSIQCVGTELDIMVCFPTETKYFLERLQC